MDLDHYRIESMRAVSEGKCLIVGFALTHCIQRHNLISILLHQPHIPAKIFRLVHSDLSSQLFHCFTSPFWRSKGRRRDMRQVPKNKPQECLHELSWHVALCKILTHLSMHFWDSPTVISHRGNHFSSLGTLTVKSAAHKKLHCSQLCFDISMAPSTRTGTCLPHEIKMLHFSFVFGAWLHKPEEFGVICFGGQALALQMFPFL